MADLLTVIKIDQIRDLKDILTMGKFVIGVKENSGRGITVWVRNDYVDSNKIEQLHAQQSSGVTVQGYAAYDIPHTNDYEQALKLLAQIFASSEIADSGNSNLYF